MVRLAQCWDDGVEDDLRVMEILRQHKAKASFNLNAGLHQAKRSGGRRLKDRKVVRRLARGELVDAYRGFMIANHSMTHPRLPELPAKEAGREIREGRDALEQLFGCQVVGFAYPFGAYNEPVMELLRESGHTYARTTRYTDSVIPPEHPMALHSSCHVLSPQFWARYQSARAVDGVFYFWGHSYELVTEAQWTDFAEKIARLSADPAATWVDLPELFA